MKNVIYFEDGSSRVEDIPDPPAPKPNNAGNPYFGKAPLKGSTFVGIIIAALGVPAANRLMADPAFTSIGLWLQTSDVVIDVDDKAAQFLGVLNYLATTNAQDGHPLASPQNIAAIMAAWK